MFVGQYDLPGTCSHVDALEAEVQELRKRLQGSVVECLGTTASLSSAVPACGPSYPISQHPASTQNSTIVSTSEASQTVNRSKSASPSILVPRQTRTPESVSGEAPRTDAGQSRVYFKETHSSREARSCLAASQASVYAADNQNHQAPPGDNIVGDSEESEESEICDGKFTTDGMVECAEPSSLREEAPMGSNESAPFNYAMNVMTSVVNTDPIITRREVKSSLNSISKSSTQSPQVMAQITTEPPGNEALEEDLTALQAHLTSKSLQSLPHRHVANHLLERYFSLVHPITPYLVENEVRQQYEQLWTSEKAPSSLWVAQLNLVFALGIQFSECGPEGIPLSTKDGGNQFYRHARGFIVSNAFSRNSVGMLQTLLLEIHYQQGTGRANQCWLGVGLAIRMAQGLGLHLKIPDDSSVPPLKRELYRRLWWGCFSLDR